MGREFAMWHGIHVSLTMAFKFIAIVAMDGKRSPKCMMTGNTDEI